jgi:hypothetical protein
MTDQSDAPGPPGLREAYRIVAEVAGELARSADAPPERRRDLARASSGISRALSERPDDEHAWAEAAPTVTHHGGGRVTIPEMLLLDGAGEPRRLARLLLRALDWELPR